MIVRWEVEDGYYGKSRPQETEVPDEELEGLDEDERQELIREFVQQDFDAKISWAITRIKA